MQSFITESCSAAGWGSWQCPALRGGSLGPWYPAPVGEGCFFWILQGLKFPFRHLVVLVIPASFCSRCCPLHASFLPRTRLGLTLLRCGLFQKRWHLVRLLLVLRHFITRPFWLHVVLATRLEPGFTASSSPAIKRGIAETPLQKGVIVKALPKGSSKGISLPAHVASSGLLRVWAICDPHPRGTDGHQRVTSGEDELIHPCLTPPSRQGSGSSMTTRSSSLSRAVSVRGGGNLTGCSCSGSIRIFLCLSV